jgi:hypothetical protein
MQQLRGKIEPSKKTKCYTAAFYISWLESCQHFTQTSEYTRGCRHPCFKWFNWTVRAYCWWAPMPLRTPFCMLVYEHRPRAARVHVCKRHSVYSSLYIQLGRAEYMAHFLPYAPAVLLCIELYTYISSAWNSNRKQTSKYTYRLQANFQRTFDKRLSRNSRYSCYMCIG